MSRPTIHFAYSVPLGRTIFRRAIDKVIEFLRLTPLYRNANNFFIPWQKPVRSPHCITYHLLRTFKDRGYSVRLYSFYEHTVCNMKPGDIFIGMALPSGGMGKVRSDDDDRLSVTSRTLREYPSNRNFIVLPYSHDKMYVNWEKNLVDENNKNGGGAILIGGEIWARDWREKSPFADISPIKKTHVIMGVDPLDYPFAKKNWNPKGKRKYLYIGHDAWYKNTKELEKIAVAMPGYGFFHIGAGSVKGWNKIAEFATLTPEYITKLADEYDIFVSTSTADPGATTIVEQMCIGLAIACTPETGYEYDSITALSTTDTEKNVRLLLELQNMDEEELIKRSAANLELAKIHHNWKKFTDTIADFMEL